MSNIYQFDQSSILLHSSVSKLLISINDCSFEQDEKSSTSIYYIGGKEGSKLEIRGCEFRGKLNVGQHYVDGKLIERDSPKAFKFSTLWISLCTWSLKKMS